MPTTTKTLISSLLFLYKCDTQILLDTQQQQINQNDLSMLGNTIFIPNWQPGSLSAFKVLIELKEINYEI